MKRKSKIRTIKDVLNDMNMMNDAEQITRCENELLCMVSSPVMFFGAFLIFLIGMFTLDVEIKTIIVYSLVNCLFGILFELALRIKMKTKIQTYFIIVISCIIVYYLSARVYRYVGPAIWTFTCIQIILSMARIKKDVAIAISVFTLIMSIHVMFHKEYENFILGKSYYIPQIVLLIFLVIIISIVFKINSDRYFRIQKQLRLLSDQKDEIGALYEEITAEEEELRSQNEKLIAYTKELKSSDEKLYDLAYYDILTGLPNRKMLMEQLEKLTTERKVDKKVFHVIFIDIDSFKEINDSMGHSIGDQFIDYVADRLHQSIFEGDILGRIGGDEFALIVNRNLSRDEILHDINTMRRSFSQPFKIENIILRMTASFGIAVFPDDGTTSGKLLKSADLAMYKAKQAGKNTIKFFEKYMQDEVDEKLKIQKKLVNVLESNELYLTYQPQYDITGNQIRGFETLLRWEVLSMGIISTREFIPIAEETGMIIQIGEWVLQKACEQFKKIKDLYGMETVLTVNISTVQLKDSDFIHTVRQILINTGFNPKFLELEITESIFLELPHQASQLLQSLKKLGVRIALDDFGTGYSSLKYLKLLPFDTLKIDKSFIDNLLKKDYNKQIVGDIISLGHNLNIDIVAEGVEDLEQLRYLEQYSCDFIQGYLFSRPLNEQELDEIVKQKAIY